MGLDMYLNVKRNIYCSEYKGGEEKQLYKKVLETFGLSPEWIHEDSPAASVEVTCGYWRKANAIHKWFVDNVQGGRDECQESYVTTEQLENLLNKCLKVKKSPSVAPEILPTASGFFFGSTDYGEYYLADIKKTIEILTRVLTEPAFKNAYFYYHSSW